MTQLAYPNEDVTTTGWTTTPLWSQVDDAPGAGDADYIDAAVRAGDATCELGLAEPTDPASSSDHIIEVRAKYTTNNSRVGAVQVALYEGATLRATLPMQTLTTSFATYSYTLSSGEADALAYSDMRLRITGHMNAGGAGTQCNVQVASVRISCPDAGAAGGQPMQLRGMLAPGMRQWQPGRR